MKIMTVVGARPQFIKAAAVSRRIRKYHTEILLHTGQHYDSNMPDIFFDELKIPKPDYQLGIGSGTHAKQTDGMMTGIGQMLLKEKPDGLLVYGDTNYTYRGGTSFLQQIHAGRNGGTRGGLNVLAKPEKNDILSKIFGAQPDWDQKAGYFGDGQASEKICSILNKMEPGAEL